ncbi:MAG: hypothetical protein K8R23_09410 [Chthoniobacter sp.]|nr:hypothetical protein [Chthoniobacter sp.]
MKVAENEPAYSVSCKRVSCKLRAARITMAVVSAPGGKQLGLVTWEDLIHRLVTIAAA